jgi:hypothetical protein
MDRQRLRTFFLGGAIGALAGILLAPRSGRELRGSIADRTGEARERSRESLFQAQERMQERFAERRPNAREGSRRESAEDEAFAGPAEVPGSSGPAPAASRPPLRDVSWDARQENRREPAEEPGGEAPEDLRRRVRETRARLRARLDEPARPDPDESREE